jgi:hypothetical protein
MFIACGTAVIIWLTSPWQFSQLIPAAICELWLKDTKSGRSATGTQVMGWLFLV